MFRITRKSLFLTINQHWNGKRVVKTVEWQPYWGNATQFSSRLEAQRLLDAINGTLDPMLQLLRYYEIPQHSVPIDEAEIVR